jgi:hypothetical protein
MLEAFSGRLQNGGDAESTRCTNGDQRPTRSAGSLSMWRKLLRGPAQNLGACGRERMTQPDRSTVDIEARPVDDPERGRTSQSTAAKVITFPGRERAECLAGERLVGLAAVKGLQLHAIAIKQIAARHGPDRSHADRSSPQRLVFEPPFERLILLVGEGRVEVLDGDVRRRNQH